MTASISAQLDTSETEGRSSHYKLPAVFTSSFVLFESCNTDTKFHYTDKMQRCHTVVGGTSFSFAYLSTHHRLILSSDLTVWTLQRFMRYI